MTPTDPHDLLGLRPGADEHAIKRAFRRLAMRWHPDRNPDPVAVERFRALRAAYDSLLAGKRHANRGTDRAEKRHRGRGGGPGPEASAPRGADRRQDLALSLEEALRGGEKLVEVVDEAVCETCGGSGEQKFTFGRLCTACYGSGRLRTGTGLVRCDVCSGRGYVSRRACTDCEGSGRRSRVARVMVKVPSGVREGDELRLAGKGRPSVTPAGAAGDLLLRVVLAPHSLFRVEGADLFVRRPLSAFRLLLGGEIEVPVPGGVRRVRLAPGEMLRRTVRVEGGGFPGWRGRPAGALVVELVPVLPATADGRLGELLEAVERELSRDASRLLPEVAAWEARWLDEP